MNDGRAKRSQKHQNKTAFKITFDTQALQKQKKVSLTDLCVRCTDQLQWKLQYNKYKKMTQPSRCNICFQKSVYRTYMTACQPCVQLKKICAKCLASDYEKPRQVKATQKDKKQQDRVDHQNQIDFMKTLQERSRRTIRRNLQKGKITWSQAEQYFIDEEGKHMIGLHFRKGFTIDEDGNEHDDGEDDDVMDEDDMSGDDDEEGEGQVNEKKAKQNKKEQNTKQVQTEKDGKENTEVKEEQGKEGQNKEDNSDVEGDQVDCENDQDFEDVDDEQEEQETKPVKNTKKSKKEKESM